jgi:hypothetical protein
VFAYIIALFSSYGEVLNTAIGISYKTVRRNAFAKLTLTPDNVNCKVLPLSEMLSIFGFMLVLSWIGLIGIYFGIWIYYIYSLLFIYMCYK